MAFLNVLLEVKVATKLLLMLFKVVPVKVRLAKANCLLIDLVIVPVKIKVALVNVLVITFFRFVGPVKLNPAAFNVLEVIFTRLVGPVKDSEAELNPTMFRAFVGVVIGMTLLLYAFLNTIGPTLKLGTRVGPGTIV